MKVFQSLYLGIENLQFAGSKNNSTDLALILTRLKYVSSLIDIIMSVLMIHKKDYLLMIIMTTFDQEKI